MVFFECMFEENKKYYVHFTHRVKSWLCGPLPFTAHRVLQAYRVMTAPFIYLLPHFLPDTTVAAIFTPVATKTLNSRGCGIHLEHLCER